MKLKYKAYIFIPDLGKLAFGELGSVHTVDEHLARGRCIERSHDVQHCRFAAAGLSYDRAEGAFLKADVDVGQHLSFYGGSVNLVNMSKFENVFHKATRLSYR